MARKRKPSSRLATDSAPLLVDASSRTPPEFLNLLRRPLVKDPLPSDFSAEDEAEHLAELWKGSSQLQTYKFDCFIYAGGSGLVFKVFSDGGGPTQLAMKIARRKLYAQRIPNPNVAQTLSPLSASELRALNRLSHANIVHLHDTIADQNKDVFAIITSFVNDPKPLDGFLRETLGKIPKGKRRRQAFSLQRLDDACVFLLERFKEIVDAVTHMHEQSFFHCDLKPANILIESLPATTSNPIASRHAILTDLGSCVRPEDADEDGRIRIHFTWTYAHPGLRSMSSDPSGISGGGLKASAKPRVSDGLERFDLFALGRTLQESLAELELEFGERCYASYNFRFLHLISALLLDGHNAPLDHKVTEQDGRRFIRDIAMSYPGELFRAKKVTSATQLNEHLRRFSRSYWPSESLPELDPWTPNVINTGVDTVAPFSERVAEIFRHPAVNRLRSELQLGWVKEVYPGATHTRWSHSLGVFATAADYYSALLADPEVPSARILLEPEDIEHGLVAAILHDLGQISFGHDIEAAAPELYDHEHLIQRLLDDRAWQDETLADVITKYWPRVKMSRVLAIIKGTKRDDYKKSESDELSGLVDPVDGIAQDIISGPIDADKVDYLIRDSTSCRVPYGFGIDRARLLRAITVDAQEHLGVARMALAYRSKGTAAIESLLLARYQMYGAVYWHHTFRSIQAMFTHAMSSTFDNLITADGAEKTRRNDSTNAAESDKKKRRIDSIDPKALNEFFYRRVVCGHTLSKCREILRSLKLIVPTNFFEDPLSDLVGERTIEFLWKCAEDPIRELVLKLARRELFRRVYEVRVGDLRSSDYSAVRQAFEVPRRVSICTSLQKTFLDSINKQIQQKGEVESVSESAARQRHNELSDSLMPLIVVDFPMRGIPKDENVPSAIPDPARKYISGRASSSARDGGAFATVSRLQKANATVRVFAEREFHELIVRYLEPRDVQKVIESVLPILRVRKS
jgi:HD superfamily phosphohydrolase